jgi:hypothetical protein
VFQKQIRKDSIVKSSKKAINRSGNTNPFNHEANYIKLYTSLKDGTNNMDEYGQLKNTKYLDDVFNFATSLPALTRTVRVQVDREEYIYLREVHVLDYDNANVAKGKTAKQSSTLDGKIASNAVDGDFSTFSITDAKKQSKYHISACNFPKYHL